MKAHSILFAHVDLPHAIGIADETHFVAGHFRHAGQERAGLRRRERLRQLQLRRHPVCKFCLERGIVTAANVVDHVTPHRGDWNAFVTGELQSLCEPCHKSSKRQIESRGYRADIGLDGYPTDPNHPFNRAR